MSDSLFFARSMAPNVDRHRALDERMRIRLADSLSYIAERCRGAVPFDEDAFATSIARIRAGAIPALAFAAYGDLVLALDDDDLALGETLLAEIPAIIAAGPSAGMLRFADPAEHRDFERYERWMNTAGSIRVLPLSEEEGAAFSTLLDDTWRLMERGAPALAAETRLLAREIVAAVGGKTDAGMVFDGASSFLLWGAILLNVTTHNTRLALAQALVHESGHNLLFGLCADGPLVMNADEERYSSPLRIDRRPMDGVFHATYVTARMHMIVRQLLDSGVLEGPEREEAEHDIALHERGFADGLATVREHGKLTPLGEAAIGAAEAYMHGAASTATARGSSALPSAAE
jgi:HEXXH motif-containing protein